MNSKVSSYITSDKSIRIYIANTTSMVKKAVSIHQTSPISTIVLGRTLTAASILGKMLKSENDTVTLQIVGSNQIKSTLAVAKASGNVKGYISNTVADMPLTEDNKLDIGGAVGIDGKIVVIKDLGLKNPYVGQTGLLSGEIADDLAIYFLESEQLPTMVSLGEVLDKDEFVKASGGILIQTLPDISGELLDKLNKCVETMKPMSEILKENISDEDIVKDMLKGFDVELLETNEVDFICDCSREKMFAALRSIDRSELRIMLEEDGQVELQCHFCNTFHTYNAEDLTELL